MAALAGGIAALIVGIILIIAWWSQFIDILMGALPIILIMGGALAAYLGFEEIKDKRAAEDEGIEESPEVLKSEVETLREEIKELKEEKEKGQKEKAQKGKAKKGKAQKGKAQKEKAQEEKDQESKDEEAKPADA